MGLVVIFGLYVYAIAALQFGQVLVDNKHIADRFANATDYRNITTNDLQQLPLDIINKYEAIKRNSTIVFTAIPHLTKMMVAAVRFFNKNTQLLYFETDKYFRCVFRLSVSSMPIYILDPSA